MSEATEKYRDTSTAIGALAAISQLAEQAVNEAETGSAPGLDYGVEARSCVVQSLPARLLAKAAEVAVAINPQNAPVLAAMMAATDLPLEPMHLTVLTSKYWGPRPRQLTVSFMEPTPQDLKARILQHMNAWSSCCCISFALTNSSGDVRISRGAGGYWSYLGTDIRLIPANNPTMNLQGFTMSTSEGEYKRVVRHETGHTLGFPHEHMRRALVARIDPQKAYDYFLQRYGWSKIMVDQQVLTPLPQGSFMGTRADQDSIMCYQLPGSITRDGLPIRGGLDIDTTDCRFASEIYPQVGSTLADVSTSTAVTSLDWDESKDVTNPDLT
jgi:hypothetical protein